MAIKRTIKRQNLVSPVAMDYSSGGLAMSQASQNIANTISNVTKFVDDNQFQQAVLDAEIAGRQLGTQTTKDKEGNTIPKPLDQMSLNSFTADIYNKANLRKAQQYFKKEAINSYGLALQNHAQDVANQSFQENQGRVDGDGNLLVKSAGEQYIDGIKKNISPEVFNVISPTLSNVWGKATRQASAQRIKDVKNTILFEAQKGLNNILVQEINNISNGADDESIEFVERRKSELFELIDSNSASKLDADKAKIVYGQELQTGVAINAVDLAIESGVSIPELLQMAIDTRINFANDPNIDGDKVETAMKSKIAIYEKLETDIRQKSIRESTTKLATLQLNLINNTVVSETDIQSLRLEDQVRFYKFRNAFTKTVDDNVSKNLNTNISDIVNRVKQDFIAPASPTQVDFAEESSDLLKNRAKINIINDLVGQLGHKDISNTNKNSIYGLVNDVQKETLKISNDGFKAMMERMFNGSESTPMIPPNMLLKKEYIDELKKKGVVGLGTENAYTEEQWTKRVLTYDKEYRKKQKEAYEASKIGVAQEKGVELNVTQKNLLENNLIPQTFTYNGAETEYDVTHPNEQIRNESIAHYAKMVQSFGYIPQKLSGLFNSVRTLKDDNFTFAKMAYSTIKAAVYKKEGRYADSKFQIIANNSGIDLSLMESSMYYDDAGMFREAHKSQSINRSLSEHFALDGSSDEEIFDAGFQEVKEYLDGNFITNFFTDNIGGDPYEERALKAFISESGAENFEDAIIRDPSIKNEMIKYVKYKVSQGAVSKDTKGLQVAVKQAFFKFAPNLSIHEDQNGKTYLIKGVSIVRQGQTTVPSGGPVVTKDMIVNDMLRSYNSTFAGGTQDPVIQDAIDKGHIMFIGNNESAGQQTYKVVAVTEDGRFPTLADNYTWDYNGSQLESDYYEALEKIQDGGVRKLLGSFDFMSRNNLEAVMDSIQSNRDYAEGFKKLVNTYNSIATTINRAPVSYTQILPYLTSDTNQKDLENFFDRFRALRFDVR